MQPNQTFRVVGIPIPKDQNFVVLKNQNIPFAPIAADATTMSGASGTVIWATVDATTLSPDGATFNLSGAPVDDNQTINVTFYGYVQPPTPRPAPVVRPPPAVIPERRQPRGNTVTLDDARQFMFDRTAADNPLDLDLSFTEKDLQSALRFTAMRYNAIPPHVLHVRPDHLPFGETMLNGVAYYLYLGKLQQLSRNDVDYSAGNMTIDINKRRIDFIQKMLPMFKETFERQAKEEKVTMNLEQGYASVGGTCGYWD